MKISDKSVVTMHYSVMDKNDTVIDSSLDGQPLTFIQGIGFLIPGLENALLEKEASNTFSVTVAAEDAYGERIEGFVQELPKEMFDSIEDLGVGTQLRAATDDGEQSVMVVDIDEETNKVTVDGNHPLAGLDLTFDVEIISVREATAEELEHGHAHGEGGCSH